VTKNRTLWYWYNHVGKADYQSSEDRESEMTSIMVRTAVKEHNGNKIQSQVTGQCVA